MKNDVNIDMKPCDGAFKIYKENPSLATSHCNDGTDHVDSQEMCNTNACGVMEFVGGESKTRAKYIRLSDQTKLEDIECLLKTFWGLKEWPKVLISVLGGVHGFSMNTRTKKLLQKELSKLCHKISDMSTEAWIITKGTDSGVTKLVAEAMQGNKYKNTFVIGITPWEKLHGRNDLKQPTDKITIPKYAIKKKTAFLSRRQQKEDGYYLNKDHTHFFLVDTGPQNSVGKEINFRNKFVKYVAGRQISESRKEIQFGPEPAFVCAIHLVINGGIRTLAQIKHNLFPTGDEPVIQPIVVIAETGRVADWLTFAYEKEPSRWEELKETIKETYTKRYEEIFQDICLCMEKKVYMTIYYPNTVTSLEEAIIRTLIRPKGNSEDANNTLLGKLIMMMAWGREDIAEEELLKIIGDKKVELPRIRRFMENLLLAALRQQQMDFFDMILRIGFDINEFDKHMLTNLYKQVLLKDRNLKRNVLFTFIDPNTRKYYVDDNTLLKSTFLSQQRRPRLLSLIAKEINKLLSLNVVEYYNYDAYQVDDPEKELFLWAVLCNKHKVASVLWKRGDDPIAKALVARKLYSEVAKRYKVRHPFFDEPVYKGLLRHARYFENEALNLLEKCSKVSTTSAAELVDISLVRWNKRRCMELAALSEFEQFIAHQRCQDITDLIWRGDFALYGRYLHAKIIFAICFFPFLWLLKYKDTYRHKNQFCCNSKLFHLKCLCAIRGVVDKAYAFYNAPITKFWRNSIFYALFLLAYVYFVLNPLKKKIEIAECLVLTFIVAYMIDEIRSLLESSGINFRQKLHVRWADPWNKVDCFALSLFVLAVGLQQLSQAEHDTYLTYSRFLFALDFVLWTVRLLQILSLHEQMGVYVVMFQRMVGDVVYFIAIIFVFIFGYGIARTSILHPYNELKLFTSHDFDLGRKIFIKPIFHIFGDLFLDTAVNSTSSTTMFQSVRHDQESETIMLVFQFVYIILTNLLFTNLLIAVFNNTYEAVERYSDRIWKWQNYRRVVGYQAGPLLPAPLSVLGNILYFCMVIIKNIKKQKPGVMLRQEKVATNRIPMADYFKKDTHLNSMKQFENECLSKYLIERHEYVHRMMMRKERIYGTASESRDTEGSEKLMSNGIATGMDGGFLLYASDDDE